MSIHNIIGSEAYHRRQYAPGFGSIRLNRPAQSGRLLRRIGLAVLTMAGCAVALALKAQGIN